MNQDMLTQFERGSRNRSICRSTNPMSDYSTKVQFLPEEGDSAAETVLVPTSNQEAAKLHGAFISVQVTSSTSSDQLAERRISRDRYDRRLYGRSRRY